MKESDMRTVPFEWQASRASFEMVNGFLMHQLSMEPEESFPTNTGRDPTDLDETVTLTKKCIVPGFQTVVTHG